MDERDGVLGVKTTIPDRDFTSLPGTVSVAPSFKLMLTVSVFPELEVEKFKAVGAFMVPKL